MHLKQHFLTGVALQTAHVGPSLVAECDAVPTSQEINKTHWETPLHAMTADLVPLFEGTMMFQAFTWLFVSSQIWRNLATEIPSYLAS